MEASKKYDINLFKPLILPREITTKEEYNVYLESVYHAFGEHREKCKWGRVVFKILVVILCGMMLLLSLIFPIFLIGVAFCIYVLFAYKLKPTGLTMHEKNVLKDLQRQFDRRKEAEEEKNKRKTESISSNNIVIPETDEGESGASTPVVNSNDVAQQGINYEVLETYEEYQEEFIPRRSFSATKKVGTLFSGIHIDERSKSFKLVGAREFTTKTFDYSDLIDCELLEDGHSIIKTTALPKAIAGGLLFGGIGAVVGGVTGKKTENKYCNKLTVKFTVRNCRHYSINFDLIRKKTKKDSSDYKKAFNTAQKMISAAKVIQSEQW